MITSLRSKEIDLAIGPDRRLGSWAVEHGQLQEVSARERILNRGQLGEQFTEVGDRHGPE